MAFTESEKEMAKRNLKQFCSKWTEFRHDEIHNKPYFIGKRSKDSSTEILFPFDCYKTMTFEELKASIVDSGSPAVNLAVSHSDSTVVLYKAELGLKPPKDVNERDTDDVSPEQSRKRKSDSMSNKPLFASVGIEQIETSSTKDCLQIDLHPDNESEASEAGTGDSDSNLDDKSDSMCS